MKLLYCILSFCIFISCKSKQEMPEFVTDDPQKTEEYADKAIQEAEKLLDSLEKMPVLNTEI